MTIQRRHGFPIKVWRTVTTTDRRGNPVKAGTSVDPHEVTAWVIPQRSARGEVPGQLQINVVRIGVSADLEDVDLWSRVEYDGKLWDIAAPPARHTGSRQVRHWSIDLRERP